MKIGSLRRMSLTSLSLPKIAVLATGLAVGILAATMSPQAADATPRASSCAGCHAGATASTTTAVPSTTTPAPGAAYTVAITLTANPAGGKSGYGIVPSTAGTGSTFGGNTGALLSYSATMTAPAAAGTYSYTAWTNQGSTSAGEVGSAVYTIKVTAASTTTPPTSSPTAPVTGPSVTAPPVTAPSATAPVTAPPVTAPLVTAPPGVPAFTGPTDIHGPYTLTSDQCGICHRAHSAKAPNLLVKGSQGTLCLSCHDGTGANANVQAQYSLVRPVNNPEAREYYSHDALAPSKHTSAELDEFGGVSDRHSECADCHNSHRAKAAPNSVQTTDGWDASGRLAGVSGVSVKNGLADTAPAYTFLNGSTSVMTREYQLCFKCHSGATTLPPPIAGMPSTDYLDKAVEFNPNNPSFHPVESPGKNGTKAMAASLAGTSPYKLWDFTVGSTIRCLNCHASSTTPDIPPASADSALAPHTSANRGILLRNYKDRVLKTGTEAYSAMDFALCYVCHGEAPFVANAATSPDPAGRDQTNFSLHSKHVSELAGVPGGTAITDINTPGAGQGNAICAECHFRLHSTTYKVDTQGQKVNGSRLVNFAPNVMPNGATLSWTQGATGGGSCTLTCHGVSHDGYSYGP